jgi:putative MFS transporter
VTRDQSEGIPAPAGEEAYSIAARLNRLPIIRPHQLAVLFIGLGLFFDIYEVFLAGVLSGVFEKDFGMGSNAIKAVLASAFAGQFVGAILFGRLADRLGRRRAFLLNLAIYSVFSFIGGLAPNAGILVAARFIAGMGLGAELALADTYLSDLLPAKSRGRYIAWAYTVGFLGVPAAGFLARWLVPLAPLGVAGWRWMFFLGALGAFLVWWLRRRLPESPRWLEAVGRAAEAETVVASWEDAARAAGAVLPPPQDEQPIPQDRLSLRTLFEGGYMKRTVMLWIMNALEVFGYYGFGSLATLVLLDKGYSIVTSLTFVSFTFVGYPIGSALSLPIIERVERKTLITASALAMGVFGLLFGYASGGGWIVAWGFLFTMTSNIFSNAFHVYLAEVYPTALRATAAGAAYSISRIVTALLPYILIPVLDHWGGGAVYIIVAIALVLLAINVTVLGPRTTGLALETAAPATTEARLDDPEPQRAASGLRGGRRRRVHS